MHYKQLSGLVILVIGIVAIIYAVHSMNRISEAKSGISEVTSFFSGHQMGKIMGGEMQHQASSHDQEVKGLLIGGIVLVVVGGSMLFYRRRSKR